MVNTPIRTPLDAATANTTAEAVIATRRSLHGIAECLLAGPQYRVTGEIALRVTDDGFGTTAGPALRVAGTEIVTGNGRTVPARGSFAEVAAMLGVEFGRPALDYPDGSGAQPGDEIILDPIQLPRLLDWLALSAAALRRLTSGQEPILWPEHFDVAVLIDDHSYGSSPGDDDHPPPYAYVSAPGYAADDFFNVPFGALRAADTLPRTDHLLAFWREGLRRLTDQGTLADIPTQAES
ncbi:MAG TPA: hypothetical protein VFP34_11790 [Microlunatus sp.]|nr:hypothetical protein [Microlunatus sp.]